MAGKKIGILALQGCVEPHVKHFAALSVDVFRIKKPEQLENCDGLVIPGGESTTFLKLLDLFGFFSELDKFYKSQKPIWGICAGAIIISKKVHNPEQKSLGWIDIEVERNAYGRQLESENINLRGAEVALIRAPKIKTINMERVQITDKIKHEVLGVRSQNVFVTTFHPELSNQVPSPFHRSFVEAL